MFRTHAAQAGAPSGRFIDPGAVAPIAAPPDAAPLFTRWLVGRNEPIVCRFSASPNTPYRVFVGLSEAYWERSGQRLMDIEVAGRVVATVDSFRRAKGTPSGHLFAATTDTHGRLEVRVRPHPGAPDQNTVVCGILLFPANAALDVDAIIHSRGPTPLVSVVAGDSVAADDRVDSFANARFVNNRVDNDLVAGMGTCQVDEFRFFTMLHQEAWDFLRWETLGNAVQDHRTWRNWPYEQHVHVLVDGEDVSAASSGIPATVECVEQQFDFRQVTVSSAAVKIDRLDMMISARQWTTALRLTNRKDTAAKVVVAVEWTTRNEAPLEVRPWSDGESRGFAYSLKSRPPILVAVGAAGTWEQQGDATVCNRWELSLKPDEAVTLDMNVHIGWAAMPAYRDSGPGTCGTVTQAILDRRADSEGFRLVKDSWSGTIWPIQTYYTVRGLANYGYQGEAAALTTNLYGMMARDYVKTGSIWEQYDPISGQDLSNLASARYSGNDVGRGYFTSGITTSVLDMLLRGLFGFERTDDPTAFYLTPTPLATHRHGIDNLPLSGPVRLSIRMKRIGVNTACQVTVSGRENGLSEITVQRVHAETGAREQVARKGLDSRGTVEVLLESAGRSRYLWEIR
jgi:hypothetical protein